MRRLLAVLALLVLALPAQAEVLVGMTDASGDVAVDFPPTGTPYSGPGAAGVDVLAAQVAMAGGDLQLSIVVADLAELSSTDVGVNPDVMFIIAWQQDGGGRSGRWQARADYHSGTWSFSAEGPCTDGDDSDGCAGEDRDIRDDVPGVIDAASNTITVLLPLDAFTGAPDTVWSGFRAQTDAVWPSYPLYVGDSAQDLSATVVRPFANVSAEGEPAANVTSPSIQPVPTTSTSGTAAPGQQGQGASRSTSTGATGAGTAADSASGASEDKPAPGLGGPLLAALVIGVALRRRARPPL